MLAWLWNWLDSALIWTWTPKRELFRYWDGAKQRSIDPVATWRKIWANDKCDLSLAAATTVNPVQADGTRFYPIEAVYAAEDQIRDLTRDIFGVKAWDESTPGLTVDETDELLNRFLAYCGDLKKKRKASPTPSAPLDSTEQEPSTGTGDFPAGASPASPSTPIGSTAAAPTGN